MPEMPERVRRRLDEIFGDVLPSVTRDETKEPDERATRREEEWLRENRPPHHESRG